MAATIRAGVLRGYADLARSVGLDPLRMLDAARIPREALLDPDLKISTVAARDLLEQSARAADDFGLRLMEMRTASVMGPVALVSREQPTLRDVLNSIARYERLHSEATTLTLEEQGDIALFKVDLAYPTPGPQRQAIELTVATGVRIMRTYLGPQWRPISVSFVHAPPEDLTTHKRIFRCELQFNHAFDGLVFDRADLDVRNPAADPDMARQAEQFIEGLAGAAGTSISEKVRLLVLGRLATGPWTPESVAQQLGLELRTLQRQLAREGASFGEIVQQVRLDRCVQLIEESDRPLAEVAEFLGFSALSAFSRWHRTHYGLSPSDRRQKARATGGPSRTG